MIPHVIHQIWLGGPPPDWFQGYADSWRRHHPDWEYKLWTEETRFDFENRDLFERAPSYAMKADILRYEILANEGGLYVDADFECHRPLDALIEQCDPLFLVSEFGTVCNSLLGGEVGSPFFRACSREVRPRMLGSTEDEWRRKPHLITGPGLVDEVYCDLDVAIEHPRTLLPGDYFFVPRTRVPHLLEQAQRKRYASHWARASWVSRSVSQRMRDLKPRTRMKRFIDLTHP